MVLFVLVELFGSKTPQPAEAARAEPTAVSFVLRFIACVLLIGHYLGVEPKKQITFG